MPKVTINEVDSIMLNTMQRLLNGDEDNKDCLPIEIENARAIQALAKTVIESKKLQFQVVRAVHQGEINPIPEIYKEQKLVE